MNVFAAVILASLAAALALDLAAEALNLRALARDLPRELRDVYDAPRYRRVRDYARARTRLGMLGRLWRLTALLAFWGAGGFPWLERALGGLGLGAVATGLFFFAALGAGGALLGLPLRWWSTFVIEERFGFNRTTSWTFWTDALKGLALAAVLGGPLLAAVLWLFDAAGPRAWLWAWGVAAALAVLVQLLAPTWILPRFNRFTPLADGELRAAILAYARSVAFPVEEIFVVDGSRRTTKANAFFTGFGRRKRIGLFDTLIATLDRPEVVAVVAHEVGHWKRGHAVQGLVVAVLHVGLHLFLLSRVLPEPGLYEAFFMETRPIHAGLVFFALLAVPLDLLLSPLLHALSRHNEYAADAFAARTTGAAGRLADALAKLSADSLANPRPHPLHVLLHHTHPPVLERVRALRAPPPRSSLFSVRP